MSERTGYKSRVSTVRGRARAQLSAIRKARLAQKRAVTQKRGASFPETWPLEVLAPDLAAGHVQAEGALRSSEREVLPAHSIAGHDPRAQETPESALDPAPDAPPPPARSEKSGAEEQAAEPLTPAELCLSVPPVGDTDGSRGSPPETAGLAECVAAEAGQVSAAPHEAAGHGEARGDPAPSAARDTASASAITEDAEGVGLRNDATLPGEAPAGQPHPAAVAEPGRSRDMPLPPGDASPARACDPGTGSPGIAEEWEVPAAPPEEQACDLREIPGIGSGLVWMLQSAGIASLADLARSDTRGLGERLGMISRLLDLDYFVAEARARTSPRGRD